MTFPSELPAALRAARVGAGLTQGDVAAAVELQRPQISLIESGSRDTTTGVLQAWARACGYRVELVRESDTILSTPGLTAEDRALIDRLTRLLPVMDPSHLEMLDAMLAAVSGVGLRHHEREVPMSDLSALHAGRYQPAELARMVGLPPSTARRWLGMGPSSSGKGVVKRHPDTAPAYASFLDLVEVLMIRDLVKGSGLSLKKVRGHVAEAERLLGIDHPLARRRFLRDGDHLFVGLSGPKSGPFIELGENGQVHLEGIVRQRALALDFDGEAGDELACRWWPMGREGGVTVDPSYGWGNPVVAGTRIYTRVLASMVRAEGNDFDKVAWMYELSPAQVHRAVEFEGLLAA